MSIKNIVTTIATTHQLTQVKTRRIIDQLVALILSDVQTETVRLPHFGTFKTVERQARTYRNIRTGEPVEVPSKNIIKFKPLRSTAVVNV